MQERVVYDPLTVSILYLRCSLYWFLGDRAHRESFNSLFEMPLGECASTGGIPLVCFNSLFEMPGMAPNIEIRYVIKDEFQFSI